MWKNASGRETLRLVLKYAGSSDVSFSTMIARGHTASPLLTGLLETKGLSTIPLVAVRLLVKGLQVDQPQVVSIASVVFCSAEESFTTDQWLLLLCAHKFDNHADDARSPRAGAQIYAGVLDFILEQLVKLTAKFFHEFCHLQNGNIPIERCREPGPSKMCEMHAPGSEGF